MGSTPTNVINDKNVVYFLLTSIVIFSQRLLFFLVSRLILYIQRINPLLVSMKCPVDSTFKSQTL